MRCIFHKTKPSNSLPIGQKILLHSSLVVCVTCRMLSFDSNEAFGSETENQFEIDLKDLEKFKGTKKNRKESPLKSVNKGEEPPPGSKSTTTYTVKPGDNLFKILIRDFGLSNREAELRIPEIVRINNLSGSTRLPVGKKLFIPSERQIKAVQRRVSPSETGVDTLKHKEEQKTEQEEPEETVTVIVSPDPAPEPKPPLTVHSIPGSVPDQTLDLLLTAINVQWTRNRVIEGSAGEGATESFSIKVERYLELDGRRYVLTGTGKDPYSYTIFRLLEMAGYTVIHIDEQSGITSLAPQLLTQLGFSFSAGKHRFKLPDKADDPRVIEGFLVSLKNPRSLVFITETPLDAVTSENLASSTVEAEK